MVVDLQFATENGKPSPITLVKTRLLNIIRCGESLEVTTEKGLTY